MAYRLESRIKVTATDDKASQLGLDGLSALIHPRSYMDLGPEVDGSLKDVNLFGGLRRRQLSRQRLDGADDQHQ